MGEKHLLRLCEAIKQFGWLTRELVADDGAGAALFLLRSNKAVELQKEIFPVVVAASKKGYVKNGYVAWFVDSIRINANLTQIFGTQIKMKDDLIYLYPLENEAKVDEWRIMYDLPPLAAYIKYLQSQYQMAVLKSPRLPAPQQPKEKQQASSVTSVTTDPALDLETDEVVKVESNLVNLNVRVYAGDSATADNFNLQKSDFAVFENGKEQEIEFFSATETPFDLILLLDLSGSTADKQDLIRKSTRRFIEASRPSDRIAIITFTNEAKIVADLTENRAELLKSIKNIDDNGGSGVWGAIRFALEKIVKPQSQGRRSAILIMTDGVDSSLYRGSMLPASYPTFPELLETVRSFDTAIIPIYLDTEKQSGAWERKAYSSARRTLSMLAEESGSQMFYARKVDDLSGIYEKIINDLGKVYSLGYQSSDDNRDGAWRTLTVNVKNHPNLVARAKAGYYAK
jgi:VWFA-related protein